MNCNKDFDKVSEALDTLESALEAVSVRDFAQAVEDAKEGISAVAHHQARLKALYERADECKKTLGKVYDHCRVITLPDLMEAEDVTSVNIQGVGRVTVTSDLRVSIPTKAKTGAYAWLEENGYGDLITETVNSSSLKATIRRIIGEGEEVPEDLFNVTPVNRASITKA